MANVCIGFFRINFRLVWGITSLIFVQKSIEAILTCHADLSIQGVPGLGGNFV